MQDGNPFSPTSHPTLTGDTANFLSRLPRRRTDAGRFSLLRVIASFPAEPRLKRCMLEDPDVDRHPIACLDMGLVERLTKGFSPTNFLQGLEKSLLESQQRLQVRKRKRETAGVPVGHGEGSKKRKKINLN